MEQSKFTQVLNVLEGMSVIQAMEVIEKIKWELIRYKFLPSGDFLKQIKDEEQISSQ